jgi:lysophospholipase L1-like esterase
MKRAYGKQGIGFVNTTAGFAGRDAICTFAYVCDHPDDVHLNARGYARLARLVEKRLTSQP